MINQSSQLIAFLTSYTDQWLEYLGITPFRSLVIFLVYSFFILWLVSTGRIDTWAEQFRFALISPMFALAAKVTYAMTQDSEG